MGLTPSVVSSQPPAASRRTMDARASLPRLERFMSSLLRRPDVADELGLLGRWFLFRRHGERPPDVGQPHRAPADTIAVRGLRGGRDVQAPLTRCVDLQEDATEAERKIRIPGARAVVRPGRSLDTPFSGLLI